MKILIDTHCWLWWFLEPGKLSVKARNLIQNPENSILFSAASSWEICIKMSLKKLKLPLPVEKYIPDRLRRQDMSSLPISISHTLKVEKLPMHHKDPFDRILIAQSQTEDLPLLTADKVMKKYDIDILWGK